MKLLRQLSCLMLLFTIISCGGSGGNLSRDETDTGDGGGAGTTGISAIELSQSNKEVSLSSPMTITARYTEDGIAVEGKLISFMVDNEELAHLDTKIGTRTTNAEGIAEILLIAGAEKASGTVTASIDDEILASITFDSLGDGVVISEQPVVASLDLFVNTQQLASSGADSVDITVLAKDENNNLLSGVDIIFSASSGALVVTQAQTADDGKATATLTTEADPENRTITVTASNGVLEDFVDVVVTGTSITFNGSNSLAISDPNTFFINLLDSDGQGIGDTDVTLSVTGVSTETPAGDVADISVESTVRTNSVGQGTFSITGDSGGTNTIIANALGANATFDVTVQSDSFLFSKFNNGINDTLEPSLNKLPDVALSDTAEISLLWLRSGSAVPDGTVVNFTTTRGSLVSNSATTVNGIVTAQLNSLDAGKALVTFSGVDNGVTLSNQLEFEFVAETVSSIVTQAYPKSIGPGGQTATISVVVKDVNGNLVKNKTIDFTLSDVHGGTIFPASAVTDSNGSATTVYTSNTVSAKNEISILAKVSDEPSVFATEKLTVADRAVFIALGTGNDLIELSSTTYNKQYSALVTDINGTPITGARLKVSAIPKRFYKGEWQRLYNGEEFIVWYADHSIGCLNEDLNLDGVLDVGEDVNNDNLLTPGNVVAASDEVITDDNGVAVIDIIYPQSFGQWVDLDLIVSSSVNGTDDYTISTFTLPVSAEDINVEDITPPNDNISLYSPFGLTADCGNTD